LFEADGPDEVLVPVAVVDEGLAPAEVAGLVDAGVVPAPRLLKRTEPSASWTLAGGGGTVGMTEVEVDPVVAAVPVAVEPVVLPELAVRPAELALAPVASVVVDPPVVVEPAEVPVCPFVPQEAPPTVAPVDAGGEAEAAVLVMGDALAEVEVAPAADATVDGLEIAEAEGEPVAVPQAASASKLIPTTGAKSLVMRFSSASCVVGISSSGAVKRCCRCLQLARNSRWWTLQRFPKSIRFRFQSSSCSR